MPFKLPMRTRIAMISIAVLMALAIAVVWMFPRTRAAEAPATAGSPADPADVQKAAAVSSGSTVRGTATAGRGDKPSSACLECQKRECWNLVDGCTTIDGNAAGGPATGTPRKELCEKMLECARRTGCDSSVSIFCYCGSTDLGSCLAGKGTGVCKQAIEAAAESVEPDAVFKHLKDKTFASGVVEPLLTCETRGCREECVPYFR